MIRGIWDRQIATYASQPDGPLKGAGGYVCIYIYTYICVHVNIYIYIYTDIYIRICIFVFLCMYIGMCVHGHKRTVYPCMYTYTCI